MSATAGTQGSGTAGRDTTGRDSIGISLMSSADTEAAVAVIREEQPAARVSFRGVFYKIEADDVLEFDMQKLGERLGRPIDTDLFLVNMSSYYGRLVVSDDMIRIYSDIQPERFQ
jgi:propane monooxygenase coupling protein